MEYGDVTWGQIEPHDLDDYWPYLKPLVEQATQRVPTHLSPENLYTRASKGELSFWIVVKDNRLLATAALSIFDATDGKTLSVELYSGHGSMRWIKPLLSRLEDIAAFNGIEQIEFEGRAGWLRLLKDVGYAQKRVVMGKRIDKDERWQQQQTQ